MRILKKPKLLNVIFFVTILILLASLTVNGVLLFKTRQEKSYYDIKCEAFGVQNANLSKGQIIFIGDSITDLCPLDEYYSSLPLAAYNRGIGGDTTEGLIKRLEVSLFDLEPSKIVLMIGTNDINGENSDEYILTKYDSLLTQIKQRLPQAELYCMSIIPQNYDRGYYSEEQIDRFNNQIIRLNSSIKTMCVEKGGEYIDLFTPLKGEGNLLKKEYSDDGLHLNKKGFELWQQTLMPKISK